MSGAIRALDAIRATQDHSFAAAEKTCEEWSGDPWRESREADHLFVFSPSASHRPNCESDVDECWSSPCLHGNCSESAARGHPNHTLPYLVPVDSFNCSCPAGWAGPTCATDIDECGSDPCLFTDAGSRCFDAVASYYCDCGPSTKHPRSAISEITRHPI